jgi:hypothetical protein
MGDEHLERVRTPPLELSPSSSLVEERLAKRLPSVERWLVAFGSSSLKRSRSGGSFVACITICCLIFSDR